MLVQFWHTFARETKYEVFKKLTDIKKINKMAKNNKKLQGKLFSRIANVHTETDFQMLHKNCS